MPDRVGVDEAQVEAERRAAGDHLGGPAGHRHGEGVEELARARRRRRHRRAPGPAPRRTGGCGWRSPQPLGAVVDGVHRGDDGQQHLRGADVGGRLVAADVLLAGLQREPVRRPALGVDRDADQPAGQVPLEAGGDRHEAGVRAAVEQRDAEALGGADHDVGAERAGRLEQGEREQVGGDHGERVALVGGLDHRPRVEDPAGGAGVLHQHAAQLAVGQAVGEVGDDHLDAHRLGAGAHHLDGLRQRVGVDHERAGRLAVGAAYQRHRLGGGGALVEQRGVGGRQPGEVADHGLEVEQRLEPALARSPAGTACRRCTSSGPRARCAGSPAA